MKWAGRLREEGLGCGDDQAENKISSVVTFGAFAKREVKMEGFVENDAARAAMKRGMRSFPDIVLCLAGRCCQR